MSIEIYWGVEIGLRDGTALRGVLYRPAGPSCPLPCIVTITPYTTDIFHDRGVYFARHGYPFLTVDCRGRGASDGAFAPAVNEASDGNDVIEWLARQSFCDGRVATYGGSYGGYNQWAIAGQQPAGLRTLVPVAAAHFGTDFPMRNNVFQPYVVQWLTMVLGHASQANAFRDSEYWASRFCDWHRSGVSFREIDAFLGNPSAVFQQWLDHPEPGAFWDQFNPTAQQYAAIDQPVLTITGCYDDDQPGALRHYREHLSAAGAAADHFLVIGPWDHAATRKPQANIGGLDMGESSVIDILALHREWYASVFDDRPRPSFLKDKVVYYTIGSNVWRSAPSLSDITATVEQLYLQSDGTAHRLDGGGRLVNSPECSGYDSYSYDFSVADGPEVDAERQVDRSAIVGDALIKALDRKQLIYWSVPFEHTTDVCGFFELQAWISIDSKDADLFATVYEVEPSGRVIRLSSDVVRARYRSSLLKAELVDDANPHLYRFNRFTLISRTVPAGSRLCLTIAPMGRINETVFCEKNHGTGGSVSEETSHGARPITVTLHHGPEFPSVLAVPIGHDRGLLPEPAVSQEARQEASS